MTPTRLGCVPNLATAALLGSLMTATGSGAAYGQTAAAVETAATGWDQVPGILARIVPPTFPNRDFPITDYAAAMPIKDSLIAASALVHDLTVTTRNMTDFHRAGVKVINPFA